MFHGDSEGNSLSLLGRILNLYSGHPRSKFHSATYSYIDTVAYWPAQVLVSSSGDNTWPHHGWWRLNKVKLIDCGLNMESSNI
jgi:hypothetical protein